MLKGEDTRFCAFTHDIVLFNFQHAWTFVIVFGDHLLDLQMQFFRFEMNLFVLGNALIVS